VTCRGLLVKPAYPNTGRRLNRAVGHGKDKADLDPERGEQYQVVQ
jgi:hypothetical protein